MDFSTIDLAANADRGADCHIEHPITGEPLYDTPDGRPAKDAKPVLFRVVGQDGSRFRGGFGAVYEKASKAKNSLEKAEANSVELLTRLVIGWQGVKWEGEPLAFTPENVRMFLTKFPPIRKQIDDFVSERANFLPPAGKK